MHIQKKTVIGSATFCCLGMCLVFFAVGCNRESTPSVPFAKKTTPSGDESLLDYTKRVTEFALRKSILDMTKRSIESEIGIGELATHGYFVYPMLYDARLVIKYENDRATEISINGSATWDYRR